jgi:uncharacterized membrane protein (DUF2068 family)
MKRSGWAVGATVLHVIWVALLLGTSSYLWLLTLSPEIRHEANAADTVRGLRIAAGVLSLPGIFIIMGAFGLWKTKLWGWWMALIADLAWSSVLLYSIIDDGWANIDNEVLALFAISVFPVLFLVLPSVRKSFWHQSAPGLLAPSRPRILRLLGAKT